MSLRLHESQISTMKASQFTGKVEAESVAGNIFADVSPVKTLENVRLRLRRNGASGIFNCQVNETVSLLRRDADFAAGDVVTYGRSPGDFEQSMRCSPFRPEP